jgi:hypothetical protein
MLWHRHIELEEMHIAPLVCHLQMNLTYNSCGSSTSTPPPRKRSQARASSSYYELSLCSLFDHCRQKAATSKQKSAARTCNWVVVAVVPIVHHPRIISLKQPAATTPAHYKMRIEEKRQNSEGACLAPWLLIGYLCTTTTARER